MVRYVPPEAVKQFKRSGTNLKIKSVQPVRIVGGDGFQPDLLLDGMPESVYFPPGGGRGYYDAIGEQLMVLDR